MIHRPTISVIVPHTMRSRAADVTAVARHVEAVGLDGVFVGDHLAGAAPVADSTLLLATAAAATTRIRLGFGVLVLALRHPAWAAKQVATLQLLSGGRTILGVGLGGAVHGTSAWDAVDVPMAERGARTDAALAVLPSLISGAPTVLANGAELTLSPGAAAPPVWIGGTSAAARRRAAAHGDGWFPSMLTPEDVAGGARDLAERWAANDRGDDTCTIAVGGTAMVGESASSGALDRHVADLVSSYRIPAETASRLPLTGPPSAVAQRINEYVEAGARHLVLGLAGDDWRTQSGRLAEAVARL